MAKAPTNDQLDVWLETNKITSSEKLRNHIRQMSEDLKVNKVSVALLSSPIALSSSQRGDPHSHAAFSKPSDCIASFTFGRAPTRSR